MSKLSSRPDPQETDPISPEFCAALRAFIAGLIERNGGFARVRFDLELDLVRGEIRRFEGGYQAELGGCQATITEPYLMKAVG